MKPTTPPPRDDDPSAREPRQGSHGFVVLGMHRSGTSLLTRLLAAAGANPGERVLGGSRGNEEGHWEDARAVEINDRLLAALGRRWDDPRPLPEGWRESAAAATARDAIRRYAADFLCERPLWALKDPRMAQFAGLWLSALADEGLQPAVLLLGRHPLEVAASLAARDAIPEATSLMLWLRSTLAAERDSRGRARLFASYDALMADPGALLRRIAVLPGGDALRLGSAQGVVDPKHRHHRAPVGDLPPAVAEAWAAWLAACEDGDGDLPGLLAADAALATADALFAPVLDDARRATDQLWERTGRAEALVARDAAPLAAIPAELAQVSAILEEQVQGQRELFQAELARLRSRMQALEYDSHLLQQVRSSWSWRITKPLRVLKRLLVNRGLGEAEREQLARRLPGWFPRRAPSSPQQVAVVTAETPSAVAPPTTDPRGRPRGRRTPQAVPCLAPANPGRPDVFVWSVIDWHFRTQRPQHLARALAGLGHRVFYLSNNLADATGPGFRIESLDASGRLFQVNLNAAGAPEIYYGMPGADTVRDLRRSLGELMRWSDSPGGICIVQHPFWSDVASVVTDSMLVYDCMDHHAGFVHNAASVLSAERALIQRCDLLVVTSAWLEDKLAPLNPNLAVVRNACEFEHFATRPDRVFRDRHGRRVIGYYGAIAEWFDVALVRRVAEAFPDCLVLLVGGDTAGAAHGLRDLANVSFVGEVPYDRLPHYLYGFDCAILPFVVNDLTLATNPVKVYEYLCSGVPVVSVDLPEMAQFGDCVATADTPDAFVSAVRDALAAEARTEALVAGRRDFARLQTWAHRAQALDDALSRVTRPSVSVIVLTYNNLALTQACLDSLVARSAWPGLEIVVVDNASSDGTQDYLRRWAADGPNRKLILNPTNTGFAAGNNAGLAAASGDYLILLNNDTQVTQGWVGTLVGHLRRNPDIGLIGPVTNNIGNEARVDVAYDSPADMPAAAARFTRRHLGELTPLRTAAFFCVAMPRATYEAVGPLDEDFGVGFFEDDDYCRRVEAIGKRVACADDVFVHHHLSASFDKLKAADRQALFERNRAIYEAKWGEWLPHRYRGAPPAPANIPDAAAGGRGRSEASRR